MRALEFVAFFAIVVLSLFHGVVEANVMGIDLGSEFIKIAAIRPRTGIDIVLNEQSRRKTFQFIGFRGEDRYIGEDAKNLSPRFPLNMISMLNRIIGISYDDVNTREWFTKELMHTYELIPNERRKTIDVRMQNNPSKVFDVETLLGIIFAYLREITKEHNDGFEITDAALVIPSFFTSRQRRALIDAARLGGIKILGMITTTTAIALQYGIQNRGFSKPVDVIIYDMGTSRTEIGVYTITPPLKGAKKAESLGTITTRYVDSDPYLGGRNFDACLARKVASGITGVDLMQEIATKEGAKQAVIVMRAANKAREVLSANKDTPITFEGVLPNQLDYTTKVKREEFESWCAPLFQRAMDLVRRALDAVPIPPTDLHAFEIHGGAVRMPKFLDEMQQLLTRPVNRTLNGDESAALGAAYYAARLSGSFVVRSFSMQEIHPANITFHLSPGGPPSTAAETSVGGDATPAHRPLFVHATLPRRRRITVSRAENFHVTLYANGEWDHEVHLLDVPSVLAGLGYGAPTRDANNTHRVRLEVRLNEHGLVEVEHATANYNEWVTVTPPPRRVRASTTTTTTPPPPEQQPTTEPPSNGEEGVEAEAKDTDKDKDKDTDKDTDTTSEEANEPTPTQAATTTDDAEKPSEEDRDVQERKQRHHQKRLTFRVVYRDPQPMNEVEFEAAGTTLKDMTAAEAVKRATASAKNDLESIIIGVLGGDYLEQYANYITPEDTEAVQSAARLARDWLEDGDGAMEETTRAQYVAQLDTIKVALKPVIDKKRVHQEAIEKAKRDAVQKAIEAEKARREAEKKQQEEAKSQATEKPEIEEDGVEQKESSSSENEKQANVEGEEEEKTSASDEATADTDDTGSSEL